jgi:hypothetical protein
VISIGQRTSWAIACVVALVVAPRVQAQGKSGGKGHKSSPPSSIALPIPAAGSGSGASPLAWLDDASLLAPGSMSLTLSAVRWSGTDLAETDFPVLNAAVGLTPRVQIGVSIPRVIGSGDTAGPVGGFGTSYLSGKIALLSGASGVKVAVSPMIEILGEGAVQALPVGESRLQFGLPVSLELSQGPARVFASTGVFSRGAWFAGGGAGVQASPRVGVSASFTRSWATADVAGVTHDRRELSAGVAYSATPRLAVYGSLGRTIATTDEDGAGTTLAAGVSFLFAPTTRSR